MVHKHVAVEVQQQISKDMTAISSSNVDVQASVGMNTHCCTCSQQH